MMGFSLQKSPDGWVALLHGDQAAEIVHAPHFRAWTIEADRVRYPAPADLPGVFRGCHSHEVKALGDVFRFFGVPLPGVAEAEVSLIQFAHRRGMQLLSEEAA
ncbi:hypothetical protein HCU64_06735 [Methylobacterium sp. C25]|uniref:hypothetical protein n=1 Tax=Methylobacterium sp. C25 TaxID=2721622 RepID=UPI001F1B9CAC|nr:hypothetical protein [Methylobacterium sp. C25]MCE4223442.1 hypothetical protein [Methylobacterium sp. C25]